MSFDFVELVTERVVLKRIRGETHGEQINKVVCDTIDSLRPWIVWAKEKPTIEETTLGVRKFTDSIENYVFVITSKDNSISGVCGLTLLVSKPVKTYEVGYWLHGKYCGTGLMTECVNRMAEFAKDKLSAIQLTLVTMEGNVGSRKVAEKTGFEYVESEEGVVYETRPEWGSRTNVTYKRVL